MKYIILYHKNCPDGYGAALALYKKFNLRDIIYDKEKDILYDPEKKVFFIPSNHDTQFRRLKDILEKYNNEKFILYSVDFYTDKLLEIAEDEKIEKIYIYDHHKTTKERLKKGIPEKIKEKIVLFFDQDKSGATLTWEKVIGKVPEIMKYIEDRDIWKWSIKDSDKVLTYLDTEIFNTKFPDEIFKELIKLTDNFLKEKEKYKSLGKAMLDFKKATIFKICSNLHYTIFPKGEKLYSVNSPVFRSEIGDVLSKVLKDVICIYTIYPTEEGTFILASLRSKNEKARDLAEKYGGGGHPNAAGCKIPLSQISFESLSEEEKNEILEKVKELLFEEKNEKSN